MSTPEQRALVEPWFDVDFYLARNADVAELGIDPIEHFLHDGWRENRDPSPDFSLAAYLDLHPDIGQAGINPFLHYLAHGKAEGRAVRIDLGFRFDILKNMPSLEARLETGRPHDIPAEPPGGLAAIMADLGKRLFVTVSQDAYVDRLGGVQLCLRREARALGSGWSHLHLYPAVPTPVIDFETVAPVIGLVLNGEKRGLFAAADIAAALAGKAFGETSFAIHSLLGHTVAAVGDVLAAAGAKAGYLWLHDQTSLCASYVLLRNDVEFCGAPPPDSPACSICIYGLRRRVQIADHEALFSRFAITVLAPSQAQLELWRGAWTYRAADAIAHPHAVLVERGAVAGGEVDAPLKVAFLGAPAFHKGWPIFTVLAARFAGDPRYAFVHLGTQENEPPPIAFVPVEPVGAESTAMVEAVEAAGVDVALILSICPETFCFTAHEAAAAGAYVIAFPDSSAVARFAADPAKGRVVADEAALTALFESGEILTLSRAARRPPLYDLRYSRMTADFLKAAP